MRALFGFPTGRETRPVDSDSAPSRGGARLSLTTFNLTWDEFLLKKWNSCPLTFLRGGLGWGKNLRSKSIILRQYLQISMCEWFGIVASIGSNYVTITNNLILISN